MKIHTLGSLFDGSGGFPLAGSLCGIVPVWASEIEPYPIAVTRSRFPTMKHLGDISKINGGEIEPVDIVCFGSPCQGLSVAGLREGLDDQRSGLFMEAIRVIREIREATNGVYPRFALWENVPGAFSSNKGEDFRIVLEELIKIVEPTATMPTVPKNGWAYADSYVGDGWSLAYRVFDAQYWGVPQRRRRIYLVLDLGGERAREVLFEREGLRGYFAEGRTPWESSAAHAEIGVGADGGEGNSVAYVVDTLPFDTTQVTSPQNGNNPKWGDPCHPLAAHGHPPTVIYKQQHLFENHSQDTRYKGPLDVSPMLPAQLGTGGNNTPFVVEKKVFESHPMDSRIKELDDVCPTVSVKWHKGAADTPLVCCAIDGDKIGKAERSGGSGLGIREGDKMYTLTAKDAATHAVAYSIQGNVIDRDAKQNGCGVCENTSHTLNSVDRHGVAYSVGNGQLNQISMSEVCNTLDCMHDKQAVLIEEKTRYIVRRLTPIECARLQGFADGWGVPDSKDSFTDEEYSFWLDVRNTHAEINGRPPKQYTREQMLTWYNKLHTDSSEYKMWGNGIALPTALYCIQGMSDVLCE